MSRPLIDKPIDPFSIPGALLSMPTVLHVTGASRASIYLWIQQKRFPEPRRLGNRRVAWLAADIERWISELPKAA